MDNVRYSVDGDVLTIGLAGRIDSANAPQTEQAIDAIRQENPAGAIVVDMSDLEYISSAGLRVLLRLRKSVNDFKLVDVSAEVYEILEMTGFTEMMDVHKAYRTISVEGCEVIGQGANGKVYRIDRDTIVKVYLNPDALPEIHRERELARTAFVLGIPTAIPYDVVRIEDGGFGSVFELLNAVSFAKLIATGQKTVGEIAEMSIELLKLIHSTVVKPDSMPDMKAVALDWALFLKDHLPQEQFEKLYSLIEAVPYDDHMLHGDYHVKNVMLQNGETLLIDMDTLCHGHPVFELDGMFNAYGGFAETDHSVTPNFLGIGYEQALELFDRSLRLYLDTDDDARVREVYNKARVVGYARILRRTIRRRGEETEEGRKVIANCRARLAELLPQVDSLVF